MRVLYSALIYVFAYSLSYGQLMYTIDDHTLTEMGSGNLSSSKHIPYHFDDYDEDVYKITEKNGISDITYIKEIYQNDNWNSFKIKFTTWEGNAGFYFVYDVNGYLQEHKTLHGNVIDFTNSSNRYLTFDIQADNNIKLWASIFDIVGRVANTDLAPTISISATPGGVDTTNAAKWQTVRLAWTVDQTADAYCTELSDSYTEIFNYTNFFGIRAPKESLLVDKIAGIYFIIDYGTKYDNITQKQIFIKNIRLGIEEPKFSMISNIPNIDLNINKKQCEFDILDYYTGDTPTNVSAVLLNGSKAHVNIVESTIAIEADEVCADFKDTVIVSVTNDYGILTKKIPVEFNHSIHLLPPGIGIVTVDTLGRYIMLAWERPISQTIEKYTIYREGLTNQYTKLAEQPYNQLSVYIDNTALFNTRAYKYAITATDVCGNESPKSDAHKSIHLQRKYVSNELQLNWTLYEGAEVLGYQLLKGTTHTNMVAVDEFATDQTSYTVDNPGNYLYRIGTVMKHAVSPEVLKIQSGPFVLAMSNIAEANTMISSPKIEATCSIQNGTIQVQCAEVLQNACVELISPTGTVVQSRTVNCSKFEISCKGVAKGVYFVSITTSNQSVQIPITL